MQNDDVIVEHYRRVGAAADAPIILHDYPEKTGIRLRPALVARLYDEVPQVQVLKLEDPPTAPKVSAIRALGCSIGIVGGLGGTFFFEELERGSDGMMTGLSFPELLVAILDAYHGGNRERARQLFYDACPLLRYEFQPGVGLALRKEVYRRRGAIATAFVRFPGTQIDDAMRSELDQVLDYVDLESLLSKETP